MYISTLRNYIRAMGGELEIIATFPEGQVKIENLPTGDEYAQTRKSRALRGFLVWWAHTDLNRGPKDYESSALTN